MAENLPDLEKETDIKVQEEQILKEDQPKEEHQDTL